MAFNMNQFLEGLFGGESPLLAAARRQAAAGRLGGRAGRMAAPAGSTGGAAAPGAAAGLAGIAAGAGVGGQAAGGAGGGMSRQEFGRLLQMDIPGFDAGDQARAYAAAGAPKIDPRFAQLVANGDPATLAFIEAIKRGGAGM